MASTSINSPVRKRIRYLLSWSSSNNDTKRNQHEISNDPEIENAIVAIDKVCSSDFSQNIERETSRLSELSIDKSKSDLSSESDSEILPNQSNTGCDNSTIDDNNNHHKNETDTADNIKPVKNPEEELKSAITKVAILDGKFFVVDFNKSTIKNISAKCQFCPGAKFYKGSLRATSNFSSHLKAVHKLHYNEYKEYLKIKKNDSTNVSTVDKKRWSCCFNQEKFEEDLTHFVLDSMLPINVVERPSFRQIFNNLQIKKGESQLVHLSRYSLGKRIKTYCEESFNEIRQHLESVTTNGGFVCTTADVWTSGSRRFLGVTVRWIDQKSLARKSAAIACRRFSGTHSFDAIAKKLFEIHTSFGLTSENIRATVTDNGSNFIKAFKEFGVDVTDKDLFDKYFL